MEYDISFRFESKSAAAIIWAMSNSKTKASSPSPAEFNQLIALYNARRYAELESRARAMVGQYPVSGNAWKLLGAAQQMQGKNALAAFQKTAELMPKDSEAYFNLGVAQKGLGLLNEAAGSYRHALKINTAYAEAHSNLGNVLKDLGQLDQAVACFRSALKIKPNSADTHNNLGIALKGLGQFETAIESYRRAIEIKPDYADAYFNLGNILNDLKQYGDAIASFRKAIELRPSLADAHNNLGSILKELGQNDSALACYRKAAELKPDSAEIHSNLAFSLAEFGLVEEAIAGFNRALELKPDLAGTLSGLLFVLNYTAVHSPEYCLKEALRYGQCVARKVTAKFPDWTCEKQPFRLKIGMVSGDLRNHPVGHFLESLVACLDPKKIELIAYPTNLMSDALTTRIRPFFADWKPISEKSDEEAARLIHADGVHILIDLSGHSHHNRLPVFAWKPAPVQVTWLGYFATTGVAEMDYLIADEVGVPEANRSHFTETVWYLPDTRLCFTPPQANISVSPLPALKNGFVTFGCFQNLAKIRDEVLSTWANILASIPGSRLRMQCVRLENPLLADQLLHRMQQHGIPSSRVALHGTASREDYLAAHAEVDIILDTFPYPGGTTTCEALWMGVPTLTLSGDTLLSRQGASLLTAAGLEEWIASSVDEYVERSILMAGDLPRLSLLRANLRHQILASPVFDAPRFAQNLEGALWGMWHACSSNPKADIFTGSAA